MRNIFKLVVAVAIVIGFTMTPVLAETVPGSVSVQTIPGQSLSDIIATKVQSSWPWYLVRASGLVAGVAAVILLLSGIGAVTGHTFKFLEPLTAWATHRALGIILVIATLVHMIMLLFDKFVPFTLPAVLVPWVSQYKPVILGNLNLGSAYVALGILALYVAIAIVVTSLLWIDKKPKIWKVIHFASYFVIAAVFLHALFLGTDTSTGIGRWLWIAGGVIVAVAIIVRIRRVSR